MKTSKTFEFLMFIITVTFGFAFIGLMIVWWFLHGVDIGVDFGRILVIFSLMQK